MLLQIKAVPPFYFDSENKVISSYSGLIEPKITCVSALDQKMSSKYKINFKNIGYLALSDAYMEGFYEVMNRYPLAYFKSFIITIKYFYPASQDILAGTSNNNSVGILSHYYDRFFLFKAGSSDLAWGLVFGLPTLIIFGCIKACRVFTNDPDNRKSWLVISYMIFHITYLSIITLVVSTGDFNRYRVEFDCLYLVLLGLLLTEILGKIRQLRSATYSA